MNYIEKVKFKKWQLNAVDDPLTDGNKIGGQPNWILDDEFPRTYNSTVPMFFLLQIEADFKFETVPDAPGQMKMNILHGIKKLSADPYYELFIGNQLYFFGAMSREEPLVYVVPQSQ